MTTTETTHQGPAMAPFLTAEALRCLDNGDSPDNDGRWMPTGWIDGGGWMDVKVDPSYWLCDALQYVGNRLDLFRGIKAIRHASEEGMADAKAIALAWAKDHHDADLERVKEIWYAGPSFVGQRPVTVGTVWWTAEQHGWWAPQPHQWYRMMFEPVAVSI